MNIKELLINKTPLCMGDLWSNERVNIIFKDINLEEDSRPIVAEVFNFVNFLRTWHEVNRWINEYITKDEAKKLNAIMKCKNKTILKNKICKFYQVIQQDTYDYLFFAHKIKAWKTVMINMQQKENLFENI